MKRAKNASELFDLVHEHYGIGGYDELARPEPEWYQIRLREAARLNQLMKKRRVSIEELERALRYCIEQRIQIRKTTELFSHITPSLIAWRKAQLATTAVDRERVREDAIAEALEAGEHDWVERLIRAAGTEMDTTLDAWRNRA